MAGFNGNADAGNVKRSEIVNNLTSPLTDKPLSAAMGKKILDDYLQANVLRLVVESRDNSYTLSNPAFLVIMWESSICSGHMLNGSSVTTVFGSIPSGGAVTCSANTLAITNPYSWGVIAYVIGPR